MSELLGMLALKKGAERTKTFHSYLQQKAEKKNIPLSGVFELTPRCTLNCAMCYVHLDNSKMPQPELSTEQWCLLIDQACDAGMMYATLSGGECLLHSGFKEIYEHLRSRGVLVSLFTNATLLNEEMITWLSERKPQRIQISVYGGSPSGYEAVTGSGEAFNKVDCAINLIRESGIPFALAITASKQMVAGFEETYRYCKSKEPESLRLSTLPFQARGETARNYNDYVPSLDEQVEFYRIRLRIDGEKAIPFQCEEHEEEAAGREHSKNGERILPDSGINCTAGRTRFSITWNGTMLACNAFNFVEAYPLKDGFLPAWEVVNRCACAYIMPVECKGCEYYNACIHCPAVHWLGAGEGHCNPVVCEEGKRMAFEGIRKLYSR